MYLPDSTLLRGGTYRIVRHISSGGFGNTYEGVHTVMDAHVAIKEFFPKMFCNREEGTTHITVATSGNRELVDKLRKKFIEEAKAIFMMNHPNIVKVHDIFEENGTAYYVMDFVEGMSLDEMVKQRGSLIEIEALGYIRQVAAALNYVHSLNRLHLDIKPGNIMVDNMGKAILIDFGASKHYDAVSGENTSTLMGVNTQGYAPVEQMTQSFTKFSPATDIYALGATLYKLLTGITPPDANLLMAREETLSPLPAHISAATRNAVAAAMALIRTDRLQSINAFIAALEAGTPATPRQDVSNPANEKTWILNTDNNPRQPQEPDMWWKNEKMTPVSTWDFFKKKWFLPAWIVWPCIIFSSLILGFLIWLLTSLSISGIFELSGGLLNHGYLGDIYIPGWLGFIITVAVFLILFYMFRKLLIPNFVVKSSKELVPTDYIEVYKRGSKFAIVARGFGSNRKYGLFNLKSLRMAIPFGYDHMQWVNAKMLKVQFQNNQFFIDIKGNIFR